MRITELSEKNGKATGASLKVKVVTFVTGRMPKEFQVYEIYDENDYGNGHYIAIYLGDILWQYVDVRYWKEYNFKKFVKQIFESYYGKALKEITITEVK